MKELRPSKWIPLLFLLMGTLCTAAQHRLTLIGNITDEKSNEPVAFCNVVLMNADGTKTITGTSTDEKGFFVLKLKGSEPCVFHASYIGYENISFEINPKELAANKQDTLFLYNLKMLSVSEELQEAKVVAKIKRYEMNADKLIMNVDEATTATVVTAFDLLRKVPGVAIDKDDNLTLNGQGGVLFQFNGRDMRLGWEAIKAMLKGMNPQQVEKFEVITNPSAKYDAEGSAGIINIKMKKNQNFGFNGSANAGAYYDTELSLTGGFNLNYVDDKWTTSLNYGYSNWRSKTSTTADRYSFLTSGDTMRFFTPEYESLWNGGGHNVSFSADYLIDDNNSVGIYTTYNNYNQPEQNYVCPQKISQSPSLDRFVRRLDYNFLQKSSSNNLLLGSTYLHKFDSLGTKLQFDISGTINSSDNMNNVYTDYVLLVNDSIYKKELVENSVKNSYNTFVAKVDFQKPTLKYGTFEAGAKVALTSLDNDFVKAESMAERVQNNFLFSEDIIAAYLSYSKNLGKNTSLRAGLRFEHTKTKGETAGSDSTNTNSYSDLFPNISINHNFNQSNSLSLSYNYRISRPSYDQMNPFLQKLSDYSFKSGNPLLKPQYTHNIGLNYSLFYMAFLSVNYGYGSDFVSDVVLPYGADGSKLERPDNIATSQNLNIGLSFVAPLTKWLDVNFYGQINYTDVAYMQQNTEIKINNTSYMCFASVNFTLPAKIKLSLSGHYMSGGLWAIYKYGDSYSLNLGLSRAFLKDDKLNVSIGANNLFSKRDMSGEFTQNNMYQTSNTHIPGTMFSINLRYNFGKMYQNKKLSKIKSDDMDDRASGGTGNNKGSK